MDLKGTPWVWPQRPSCPGAMFHILQASPNSSSALLCMAGYRLWEAASWGMCGLDGEATGEQSELHKSISHVSVSRVVVPCTTTAFKSKPRVPWQAGQHYHSALSICSLPRSWRSLQGNGGGRSRISAPGSWSKSMALGAHPAPSCMISHWSVTCLLCLPSHKLGSPSHSLTPLILSCSPSCHGHCPCGWCKSCVTGL